MIRIYTKVAQHPLRQRGNQNSVQNCNHVMICNFKNARLVAFAVEEIGPYLLSVKVNLLQIFLWFN